MSSRSPLTIRHGETVIHVSHLGDLPFVLEKINETRARIALLGQVLDTHMNILQAFAGDGQAYGTINAAIASKRRSLLKADIKLLRRFDNAHAFLRHFDKNMLDIHRLIMLLQEDDPFPMAIGSPIRSTSTVRSSCCDVELCSPHGGTPSAASTGCSVSESDGKDEDGSTAVRVRSAEVPPHSPLPTMVPLDAADDIEYEHEYYPAIVDARTLPSPTNSDFGEEVLLDEAPALTLEVLEKVTMQVDELARAAACTDMMLEKGDTTIDMIYSLWYDPSAFEDLEAKAMEYSILANLLDHTMPSTLTLMERLDEAAQH